MRLLFLTALIVVVASSPHAVQSKWPWQAGQEYHYVVETYSWTKFEQSDTKGTNFKAQFMIKVLSPGRLVAKLENPQHARIEGEFNVEDLPTDLKYQPVVGLDHPFEIIVDGGRIVSLKIPTTLAEDNENLLKGLVSALQVDLSPHGHVHDFPNSYDKESFQGLFKKMETDVSGNCETMYSVSPVSAEWRRELPEFAEEPVEIVKSKNYGNCDKRIAYYFGVPEGALWSGIAYENDERQLIKHTSESRILVGKQGTIYKSETMSSVFVNPLMFGKQKAEVYSFIIFYLTDIQPENNSEWQKTIEFRDVDSLFFTMNEEHGGLAGQQNIARVQTLLQEMAPLLETPNNLPKSDFLSKFKNLIWLLTSMNSEQLRLLTNSIEVAKSSMNNAKYNMWTIYCDAVAQTGTQASFKEVKDWIMTKKIKTYRAAELISSISSTLRTHTKPMAVEFFDLAMSPEVQTQSHLNVSALLAVTKYLRFAKEDLFVVEKVIPRLSEELKQAIENDDSNKAQTYVRVLGNLAHPDIIKAFAPYLEGKIIVSKYLRTQMVISLKTLANMKDKSVQAVLYSIMKNTAEPYEVRVAAALNIFLTYPTTEMMQIMAHMVNDDPSTQVSAVLANSIAFAARLKDPRFAELAKRAKAVMWSIRKDKYGYRYSTDSIIDEYENNDEIAHFREISFIGSKNNILPIYERAALRFRGTGWTEEDWLTMSVSDTQQLKEFFMNLIYESRKVDADFKFTAEKIAEILGLKRETRSPLETAFFIETWNQQSLITFNEDDFKNLIYHTLREEYKNPAKLVVDYTKLLLQKQVFITFPLATGVPFVFHYAEPSALKINMQPTEGPGGSLKINLDITYARNMDGTVGYLDTYQGLFACSGIINKLQLNIPFNLLLESDSSAYRFTFELPEKDVNLVHMSVWPYTSLQDLTSGVTTVLEDPSTKIVERPNKILDTDYKFGQSTGVVLEFQGKSFSSDYKDVSKLFDADLLTIVRNMLYQKDVALTQFNLRYLAEESQNKAVALNIFYDTLYNQEHSGEMGPATTMADVTVNSETRREEIAERAAKGIESATIKLVDLAAVFEGKQKVEYVFTGAWAKSFVDNKVQAAIFFKGCEQINAVFKIVTPKITPLNFEKALENNIKVTYEADLKYGNFENINLKGVGERSEEYTNMLKNDPLAKQCLQQTGKLNLYQKDCYKMIIKAHAPDFFKATMTYKELNPAYIYFTTAGNAIFNAWFSFDEEKDMLSTMTEDGKMEIEAQAFYYDNYVNYKFTNKSGSFSLKNVEGMAYYPYALAIYQPINNWERTRNWFTGYQNLPYCAVDNSKVWTFSGRSYDYTLTGSWHTVMVDKTFELNNDVVILARRPSDKQTEVYVSYMAPSGKTLEIEIKPTAVEVKSNAPKVSDGALTMYWDGQTEVPILEYYALTDGVLVFHINNGAIRMMYDSQRLIIFTDDHRSTTRGICGQSSSEIPDDFMTPWGLVDSPALYGASFSLEDEFSDPKTTELKKQAKLKAYQPVTKYTSILKSDPEWLKAENKSF